MIYQQNQNVFWILIAWVGILVLLSLLILIIAFNKYHQNETDGNQLLFFIFIGFTCSFLFQWIGLFLHYTITNSFNLRLLVYNFKPGWLGTYFKLQLYDYQFTYYALIFTMFSLNLFSNWLFYGHIRFKHPMTLSYLGGGIAIVLLGIIRSFFRLSEDLVVFIFTSVDIYVILYACVIILPTLVKGFELTKKFDRKSSTYARFRAFIFLCIGMLITLVFAILETIVALDGPEFNLFSFAIWSTALVSAFLGLQIFTGK
jgi:hypothetical protein